MNCDTIRRDILQAQGYVASHKPAFYYTMRSLQIPILQSNLPQGFTIRNVAGEEEAEVVQAVHPSAFGSTWQPGEYRDVMRTPGFHIDRELVVVAPDGRFAAFLMYWVDPISKSGLFEPVGCHRDFQRLGLTKALMYEGMRRMLAQGMTEKGLSPPQATGRKSQWLGASSFSLYISGFSSPREKSSTAP